MKALSKLIIATLLVVCAGESFSSDSVITSTAFGCKEREQLDKIRRYYGEGDPDALKKSMTMAILVGQCTFFKPGEKIFIIDSKMFSGVAKVRKYGETDEFWIDFSTFKLGN